ncbi:MAG: HAD-IC family P-type ATPase [Rhodocyclaceae bacterium]|nr:HAD-IC family P-type ATPase [Rhodocyclaceae bacterium]
MKAAKKNPKNNLMLGEAQTGFMRGFVASGLLTVVQRTQAGGGKRLLRLALQGGASLAAGAAVTVLLQKRMAQPNMMAAWQKMMANQVPQIGWLDKLSPTERFLAGALLGAAAAYVLGDEQLRGKLMRSGMKLYGGLASGFEEMKEQMADTQMNAARLADRLVPLVLGLAGAAWLASGDWRRVAAVLQADFSCALKLATPVAFKATMYRAGQMGVLFKGADVVERLAEADTLIFDKTGTLTTGVLAVTDTLAFDPDFSPRDILDLAASVEEHYFHPLAKAVVEAAQLERNHHFDHAEVQFIAAHGVASVVRGKRIVVGSRHFVVEDEGISLGRQRARIERLFQAGKTLLYIGYDGRLIGVIALKDELRGNSAATIERLRGLGIQRVLMLTGDHYERAAEIAAQLGVDEFHAELLPEQKAAIVRQLAERGAKIAFVGDGINDAPALAGAHVGIAMQRGADIARLSADIALLEDGIARVADAKALANAALDKIAHNYRLTMGINGSILAAAAFGMLTHAVASILHNGSTIGILLNAAHTTGAPPHKRRNPNCICAPIASRPTKSSPRSCPKPPATA